MKVINECRLCYKYRLSSTSPIISKTIYSNVVSTQIVKKVLEVTKYVNKESTFSFDILTYTIKIKNISSLDIEYILFQDNIPKNTKFIENTLIVNNVKIKCVNLQSGYLIDGLKAREEIEISFKVVVLPYNIQDEIINYSTVSYECNYNREKEPIIVIMDSNSVRTKREMKVFKQIQINRTIYTHNNIYLIKGYDYGIDIMEIKIINNIDCRLSTLLVAGRIRFKVYYESHGCNMYGEKYVEEIFGFSTNIVVPIGVYLVDINNIEYNIENISVERLEDRVLFLDLSVLLYY